MRLKSELVDKIETLLNNNRSEEKPKLKVADVNIVFKKDPEICEMLMERGEAVAAREWTKRDEINHELTHFVKEHSHSIVEPQQAFITFQEEDGYNKILEMIRINIFGNESIVKEASSPTDTNYENLNFTAKMRRPLIAKVALYMFFIFMFSTFLTLIIKYSMSSAGEKYKNTMDCNELSEIYHADVIKDKAVHAWE